jgi:hypothetical protein
VCLRSSVRRREQRFFSFREDSALSVILIHNSCLTAAACSLFSLLPSEFMPRSLSGSLLIFETDGECTQRALRQNPFCASLSRLRCESRERDERKKIKPHFLGLATTFPPSIILPDPSNPVMEPWRRRGIFHSFLLISVLITFWAANARE